MQIKTRPMQIKTRPGRPKAVPVSDLGAGDRFTFDDVDGYEHMRTDQPLGPYAAICTKNGVVRGLYSYSALVFPVGDAGGKVEIATITPGTLFEDDGDAWLCLDDEFRDLSRRAARLSDGFHRLYAAHLRVTLLEVDQ